MKKKLLSFIFAICLIIPCAVMLSACKDKEKNPGAAVYTLTVVSDNGTFKYESTTKKSIATILEENENDIDYDNSIGFYSDANFTQPMSADMQFDYSKTIYTKMATLDKININDGVVTAKNSTISGEVVIPLSATSLQIQNCDISSLVLCQNIGTVSAQGLSTCDLLANIKVVETKKARNFYSIDGVLFEELDNLHDESRLVKYPNNKLGTTYIVPELDDRSGIIGYIGEYAFTNCINIKSVDVNGHYVNARAFYDCDSLETISGINSGIGVENHVGEFAFANCDNLETVSLNALDGADNAFNNCTKLRSINAENNVLYLWFSCIGCTSLEEIVFEGYRIIDAVTNCTSSKIYLKIPSNPEDKELCSDFTNKYTKQATSDKTGYDMYVRNAEE